MRQIHLCSMLVAMLIAGPAMAAWTPSGYDPALEMLDIKYTLDFSVETDPGEPWSSVGSGVIGRNAIAPFRLDLRDGVMMAGMYDITFMARVNTPGGTGPNGQNNNQNANQVTHILPNSPPALNSMMPDGSAFGGTALWLASGAFLKGEAPETNHWSEPLNTGTWIDGTTRAATATAGMRGPYVTVPVLTDETTVMTFYFSQDIYVPSHVLDVNEDTGATTLAPSHVRFGIYMERGSGTVAWPNGIHTYGLDLTTDVWHRVEARVTVMTNGGELASSSDDTGWVTVEYYLDGVLRSTVTEQTLIQGGSPGYTNNSGDVRLSWGTYVERGNQNGFAPELYITNIVMAEVNAIPEPMTMSLLALGGLALLRRRK